MERYRVYLEKQVRKAGIDLRLGVAATPELVSCEQPDAVIVALGAMPIIPHIPGVELPHVFPATEIFGREEKLGKVVAVIGGGMVGCETALHLASKGHTVQLVEMLDTLAPDGIYTERLHTMHFIEENQGISCAIQTKCVEIRPGAIVVESAAGKRHEIKADSVVLSVGMKSLAAERERFNGLAFDVIAVGDCKKVGTVCTATATGYDAALGL